MKIIKEFIDYAITKDGKVWSNQTKKWLKPLQTKSGHLHVSLGADNCKYIHRLVLETYVGPCPAGMECRHLNGNPLDNRLKNLRWGTRKENREDSMKHGTSSKKLKTQDVRIIKYLYSIKMFSIRDLAWQFDCVYNTIWQILKGITWYHV